MKGRSVRIPPELMERFGRALGAARKKTAGEWGELPVYGVVILALERLAEEGNP